jgi:hypothetical protein
MAETLDKPTARRHHYVPQGYLAGFTHTGTKGGQFFVLDVNTGESFRTSPKNVAAERDFNRIDIEGRSPDAIERALAPFEQKALDAIRRTIAASEFPNPKDCNFILNFLGLIAVRNPRFRGLFNRAREHTVNVISDKLASDKKVWEHHMRKARKAGEHIPDTVSFEDFKSFVEERRYRIEFLPQGNLPVEFRAFDEVLPILGQRTWSQFIAPADGPEFVCSDHPVTLVWKNGQRGPVGYALQETEVFFPLGRSVGFYGTFEEFVRPVVRLRPDNVARLNRRVAVNADRHVYSAQSVFAMWHEGRVRDVFCKPS